jgi:hypothetical protein
MRDTIPFSSGAGSDTYDVVVAGGGPAGLGAAIAAALSGAKTLLIEADGILGGVAVLGLWMPFSRILLKKKSRGGVAGMLLEKLDSFGEGVYVEGKKNFIYDDNLNIHPEYFNLCAMQLLDEVECDYVLFSPVNGVEMTRKRIVGVKTSGKYGTQHYRATIVVDATGDGDVAYHAGAPISFGREEDRYCMPITRLFTVGNADTERFIPYERSNKNELKRILHSGAQNGYTVAEWYGFNRASLPGIISVNHGGLKGLGTLDSTSVRDMTLVQRTGAQIAVDFVRIAHEKKIPGLESCYLLQTAYRGAARESRRIRGEYILTLEDAQTGAEFDDVVARKYGGIDAIYYQSDQMQSGFAYPYRSLLPKEIDSLLVAGRCGSATHLGHAAGKSMGNMMEIGQAAGVAAALCCKHNVLPRALDVSRVQKRLREMGVHLDPPQKSTPRSPHSPENNTCQ